jgi:hypothetical protein
MRLYRPAGGVIIAAACCAMAHADLVALVPAKDNTLYEDANGSLSNGAGAFFFAGRTNMGVIRRGLIAFDIAGEIPAGSVINNVTLTLHMAMSGPGTFAVSLHRALADWGEGTSDAEGGEGGGAVATVGDATWLHTFYDTNFWTNPGGDFTTTPSASAAIGGVNFYSWTSTIMATDVQQWLDQPLTNFGWLLKGDESALGTAKKFDSRQGTDPQYWPVLTIDYTPVPAPSGAVLLTMVGACWPMRRRRSGR